MKRAIMRWIVQSLLGLVGYGFILFLATGRVDWLWGWIFLAVTGLFLAGHVIILVPRNPALLVERQKGVLDRDVKTWDKWIVMLGGGVLPMIAWIVAALDVRLGWAGPLPLGVHLAGLLMSLLGYGLFLWALGANAFFSEGVRIQAERGHTVATNGPYRYVRHPGYVGAIVAMLGAPLMLGSFWALIPAVLTLAIYVLRTALEDRTLQAELPGYTEYTQRVRYRLLPGVW
jgi:protein-S-isoprenylcysteine O-methyltransferase Ste14